MGRKKKAGPRLMGAGLKSLPRQFGEETARAIGERSGMAAVHEELYALPPCPKQGGSANIRYAFLQLDDHSDTGLPHNGHNSPHPASSPPVTNGIEGPSAWRRRRGRAGA